LTITQTTVERRRPDPSAWNTTGPRPDNPHVRCGMATCRGASHNRNEDAVDWAELGPGLNLLAVADGVGSGYRSDRASRVALRSLFARLEWAIRRARCTDPRYLPWVLKGALDGANRDVLSLKYSRRGGGSTTLCCALTLGASHAWVAHIGDSRGYLLRNGWLMHLTRDHSLVNQMFDRGFLTAEQMINTKRRNHITRSVGRDESVEIEMTHVVIQPHDALLLCSDGLWGSVEEPAMAELIRRDVDPEEICQDLVAEAVLAGATDDISAVLWASRL